MASRSPHTRRAPSGSALGRDGWRRVVADIRVFHHAVRHCGQLGRVGQTDILLVSRTSTRDSTSCQEGST